MQLTGANRLQKINRSNKHIHRTRSANDAVDWALPLSIQRIQLPMIQSVMSWLLTIHGV